MFTQKNVAMFIASNSFILFLFPSSSMPWRNTAALCDTLTLLLPSLPYCTPHGEPWPILLFPKAKLLSASYLQNGENNVPVLLHRRFGTKQQHDIHACYCSIFMQLHLQNRGTE